MTSKQKSKPTNLRAVLEFRSGPHASEAIRLRRDATIFGREKGDVIVDDNEVSSTHCQIQCIDDTYHIFDMNSTNGTFVNSEKILKSKLGRQPFAFQSMKNAIFATFLLFLRRKKPTTPPHPALSTRWLKANSRALSLMPFSFKLNTQITKLRMLRCARESST